MRLVRLRPVWMTNHPPSVLWHCWLGHQTCKNHRPYNLYCVGADVKPCTINQSTFWISFHRRYKKKSFLAWFNFCTKPVFKILLTVLQQILYFEFLTFKWIYHNRVKSTGEIPGPAVRFSNWLRRFWSRVTIWAYGSRMWPWSTSGMMPIYTRTLCMSHHTIKTTQHGSILLGFCNKVDDDEKLTASIVYMVSLITFYICDSLHIQELGSVSIVLYEKMFSFSFFFIYIRAWKSSFCPYL